MCFARTIPSIGTALALGLFGAAGVQAQSADLGEFEYMNSCAVCHGIDGDGKGPLADRLNVAPPDLTRLQQNNGGVFPVSATFATIEGVDEIGAHGVREMPVWGQRYRERADEDPDFAPADVAQYSKMRILALIEYLSQIQQ